MRLIDLDKVVSICDEDNNAVIFTNIKNAEVKAIPIEWIEQWLDRVTGTKDGDDISKYHDLVKGGILFINMLERDWEKENECRGTDKPDEDTCR